MTTTDRLTTALADRYRLEHQLGQGGMATVYLAHDRKHDRPCVGFGSREAAATQMAESVGAGPRPAPLHRDPSLIVLRTGNR